MHNLVLHPDCYPGPIIKVSADIDQTETGCEAIFRLEGDISQIRVPSVDVSERTDYLWKTTCFEIFWQPLGSEFYREFNLSPSSRWACYDFDDFRLNSRDGAAGSVSIESSHDSEHLFLTARIAADLPVPADIALNAIVEDLDGNIQYWAMAFPGGKPEFHSAECRALTLFKEQS